MSDSLEAELLGKFPLLEELRFSLGAHGRPEQLPAVLGLFSAMMDPRLPGDACALLPSREGVAFLVSVLSALTAAQEHFPDLFRKYTTEGFSYGDHVRVMQTGDVYIFAGFFSEKYGNLFKLNFVDDNTNGCRSFPAEKAVYLEKTTKRTPKGRGDSFGDLPLSKLDRIIGTKTYGNHCLFSNEIMLVATKKEFIEFLETVHVSRVESEKPPVPLREVIPWGVVKPDGSIEFGDNAAAAGKPIIAVSPRTEYIAAACRTHQDISPRVIIDGASRVKDLQAFDDIVDFSKLLVVADHSQSDILPDLSKRNCTIWKLPDKLDGFVGNGSSLLGKFQNKYFRASGFEFFSRLCESGPVEEIEVHLASAEKLLRKEEADETTLKIISIAYARLLDLSAIINDPQENELAEIIKGIDTGVALLNQQRTWVDPEAYRLLKEAFEGISTGLSENSGEYRVSKQLKLLEEIKAANSNGVSFAIVCPGNVATSSAKNFLTSNGIEGIPVIPVSEYLTGKSYEEIILTGWPRARTFSRMVDSYNAGKIKALSFKFEHKWFSGSSTRRNRSLSRWKGDESLFKSLTALENVISIDPDQIEEVIADDIERFDRVEEFEFRISNIRKGSQSESFDQIDSRDARYVGFVGSAYGYMSQTHKIPKITNIVRGDIGDQKKTLLATVEDLEVGDLVLFRAHADTDKDMLRLIAEQALGVEEYEALRELAGRWKKCLKSIAVSPYRIWEKLSVGGMKKTEQAVRNWISDDNRIGPGNIEDLHVIAKVAGNPEFAKSIPEIWSSIVRVRGAHLTAGFRLSQLLFSHLPGQLPELNDTETVVDLTLDEVSIGQVVILQIEMIADGYEERPYWDVNRLLWEEE